MAALDQTIITTAVSFILSEFNNFKAISWVFTSYMLAATVTTPIYGKLSDQYGRKKIFLFGVIVFLIGSTLCGLSQSLIQLIIFRGLQGIGGGAVMLTSIAIVGDLFPPAERGKWQGLIGAVFGLASISGPILGGIIAQWLDWRWIFFINLPFGLIAILIINRYLPEKENSCIKISIDYKGSIFLVLALIPLLLVLVFGGTNYSWLSYQVILTLVCSFIMFYILYNHEKNAQDAIIPVELFKNKIFLIIMALIFCSSIAMFGVMIYLPLFIQTVMGISPAKSGLVMIPLMLSITFSSAFSGIMVSKTGKYKILSMYGIFLSMIGMYLLAKMNINTSILNISINMIITGLGIGVTIPIFTIVAQSAFLHSKLGVITASTQLSRSLGCTFGIALLGGILNNYFFQHLSSIEKSSFIRRLKMFAPKSSNNEKIPSMLTPEGENYIREVIEKVPKLFRKMALRSLDQFLITLKTSLNIAISNIFMTTTLIMTLAFLLLFFLPEIPLRKSNEINDLDI